MSEPRIAPLEPPYPEPVDAELRRWMPSGAPVEPLRLFRTLVRNLSLAEAMQPLGRFLLSRAHTLPLRERELVILRVCAHCGCGYEWGVHATAFGDAAGLTQEERRATAEVPLPEDAFPSHERDLLALADALHERAEVPDALWARLAERYASEALLELLVLAGWYHVIAFVAKGARVGPEPWAAELPRAEHGRTSGA